MFVTLVIMNVISCLPKKGPKRLPKYVLFTIALQGPLHNVEIERYLKFCRAIRDRKNIEQKSSKGLCASTIF
ncbi:Uncharacterised protein [Sporosarcina pasteurii]|uniref:Uncharacterized protein n=1 Tax=Sporosarcina pasteurii TaxID=1474 RepID=A0A380BL79_SPOPA|nr:Uncharacterised protein [Sporosarcina pasteurii]